MKRSDQSKNIEARIRSLWSSLESHLAYTHKHSTEGKAFHRKCCREYAEDIYELTKLL
jgi:hypothetical protein